MKIKMLKTAKGCDTKKGLTCDEMEYSKGESYDVCQSLAEGLSSQGACKIQRKENKAAEKRETKSDKGKKKK